MWMIIFSDMKFKLKI